MNVKKQLLYCTMGLTAILATVICSAFNRQVITSHELVWRKAFGESPPADIIVLHAESKKLSRWYLSQFTTIHFLMKPQQVAILTENCRELSGNEFSSPRDWSVNISDENLPVWFPQRGEWGRFRFLVRHSGGENSFYLVAPNSSEAQHEVYFVSYIFH